MKFNYTVIEAANGEEGLDIFRREMPDIILTDLKMPGMDGFEVLQVIKKESPDTPVLVISGEGEIDDVIKALRLGAWNYQTKPFKNMALVKHYVEQALEKSLLIRNEKAYKKGLEKKLGIIIENYNGLIFSFDNNYRITYMNPALVKHLGYDATGEEYFKAIFNLESEALLSCKKEDIEQEIQSKRNGCWYQIIQSPILDHRGNIKEYQAILYDITDRKKAMLDLQEREEYFRKENLRLKASLEDRFRFGKIIGKSKPMQEVYNNIINAAASDAGVIIYGESGTGKELVAKAIHENSDRKDKELIYVNCGSIPENLIESEFFGYKKGAFTGAQKNKHGFLDIAEGGTIFLDEIGEIPLNMQVKLLRAIEGNGYTPVGSTEIKKPDIRFISATNRNLVDLVQQGAMREDFFYRIHIIPIRLPPLRERKEDIPLLIEHFMGQYEEEKMPLITPQIVKYMQNYDWPGNIRELQNTIHRLITLRKLDFSGMDPSGKTHSIPLENGDIEIQEVTLNEAVSRYEKRLLMEYLDRYDWHKGKVSEVLKIDRKTLFNKMKRYNLLSCR